MKVSLLKRTAFAVGVVAIAAAPVLAATVWGPSRPVLHFNGPGTPGADHVTFNSFDNNPNYGDERTFFDGKVATDTATGNFQDVIQVNGGTEYILRTYVHNNADSSLNASGTGIAKNTKVSIQLPTATATSLAATSIISADNAAPGSVFDTVNFQNSNQPFSVSYVPGSAVEYTNAVPAGMPVSDTIVNGGAQIGYDKTDGNVPGCFQYTAIVTIKVKINAPSISLTKGVVETNSTNDYTSNINAKTGDLLTWSLHYKNTSSAQVDNITIKDQLPAHLQVVPGTVKRYDSNNANGQVLSDTGLFSAAGVNVGSLGVNGGGYITFRTTVLNDFKATDCQNDIKNTAVAVATGVSPIYASADVYVNRVCVASTPTPTPSTPPVTPPATPNTPLPQTGAEGLAGLTGLGAIGYAVQGYVRSKKSLLESLRK